MKLGGELKILLKDLSECIREIKQVIAGLKSKQAVTMTDDDSYGVRSNGRALAEKLVIVSVS